MILVVYKPVGLDPRVYEMDDLEEERHGGSSWWRGFCRDGRELLLYGPAIVSRFRAVDE